MKKIICVLCGKVKDCLKFLDGTSWSWACRDCLDEMAEDGDGYVVKL